MERPKAITAAAIVSGALLAGSLGMTANAGILSSSNSSKVGQLSRVSATTPAVTAEVQPSEETAAAPAAEGTESASETRSTPEPGRTAPPTVTTAKPKSEPTEPKSDSEKPESTTEPHLTSTTAPGVTTTAPHDGGGDPATTRDD